MDNRCPWAHPGRKFCSPFLCVHRPVLLPLHTRKEQSMRIISNCAKNIIVILLPFVSLVHHDNCTAPYRSILLGLKSTFDGCNSAKAPHCLIQKPSCVSTWACAYPLDIPCQAKFEGWRLLKASNENLTTRPILNLPGVIAKQRWSRLLCAQRPWRNVLCPHHFLAIVRSWHCCHLHQGIKSSFWLWWCQGALSHQK